MSESVSPRPPPQEGYAYCCICSKHTKIRSYAAHLKRMHDLPPPEVSNILFELKKGDEKERVACDVCGQYFVSRSGMMRHRRDMHSHVIKTENKISCIQEGCIETFYAIASMAEHVHDKHREMIVGGGGLVDEVFPTQVDFERWREEQRKLYGTEFSKQGTRRLHDNTCIRYMRCAATTRIDPISLSKRGEGGVRKRIVDVCTADIKVTSRTDGSIHVKGATFHVGHNPATDRQCMQDKAVDLMKMHHERIRLGVANSKPTMVHSGHSGHESLLSEGQDAKSVKLRDVNGRLKEDEVASTSEDTVEAAPKLPIRFTKVTATRGRGRGPAANYACELCTKEQLVLKRIFIPKNAKRRAIFWKRYEPMISKELFVKTHRRGYLRVCDADWSSFKELGSDFCCAVCSQTSLIADGFPIPMEMGEREEFIQFLLCRGFKQTMVEKIREIDEFTSSCLRYVCEAHMQGYRGKCFGELPEEPDQEALELDSVAILNKVVANFLSAAMTNEEDCFDVHKMLSECSTNEEIPVEPSCSRVPPTLVTKVSSSVHDDDPDNLFTAVKEEVIEGEEEEYEVVSEEVLKREDEECDEEDWKHQSGSSPTVTDVTQKCQLVTKIDPTPRLYGNTGTTVRSLLKGFGMESDTTTFVQNGRKRKHPVVVENLSETAFFCSLCDRGMDVSSYLLPNSLDGRRLLRDALEKMGFGGPRLDDCFKDSKQDVKICRRHLPLS